MADTDPTLHQKLHDLEQELEDGEITEKGYQKRRAQLLSQYGVLAAVSPPASSGGGLRLRSPDNDGHGHRMAARTVMSTGNGSHSGGSFSSNPSSPIPATFRPDSYHPHPGFDNAHPMSLLRPGGSMAGSRPSVNKRDSLFLTPGQQCEPQFVPLGDPNARTQTMMSSDYAFRPGSGQAPSPSGYDDAYARTGTLLDAQGYFSDFAGHQAYDLPPPESGPQRYSANQDAFSPSMTLAPPLLGSGDLPSSREVLKYLMPLEPREVPFAINDPFDRNQPMSQFETIAAVIRYRGSKSGKLPAYWVLDSKGKETASITWDKLASKAEKVGQVIKDKSSLYKGDRVALVYRDSEIIDFAIALLGCFIAGVVAVPVSDLQDLNRLKLILTSTQSHLALTTDSTLKAFQRDKFKWPHGVEWWKTNDLGSYNPKKSSEDKAKPQQIPDLAYIEFSRAPTGDLRGVVLSHRTIMHQMACLSAITSTVPRGGLGDTFNPSLRDKNGKLMGPDTGGEVLLSYLDPRFGIGMILGVLFTVYGGHTTVWMEKSAVETPGLYAHLITKYKTTLMVADYPGLKRAAYNYQQEPMLTRNYKKGSEPNFESVKLCLIDTLTVDSEFHEVLADRWLRPLRNSRAREVVAPMLCLPEHGGMVVSVRDWLGGEERMGVSLKLELEKKDAASDGGVEEEGEEGEGEGEGEEEEEKEEEEEEEEEEAEKETKPSNGFGSLLGGGGTATMQQTAKNELSEVLLDREALKTNEVIVVAIGDEARKKAASEPGCVRVGSFGYPIPDATVAVVNPDKGLLVSPHTIGEIWVDSPSLSGGFWALPKHTEQIFHARPYKFEPGALTPTLIEPEFLRTGLLGTIIEGKVFVLGLYEDRIRQKVEWVEHGHEVAEYRYFFVQHIVVSLVKNVPKVYDCSAFDVVVNDEHLPIVVLETQAASTAPLTSGGPPRQLDMALLDSLAERCMDVLVQEHHLRLYCVLITAPNALPRVLKNGRKEIGNMLCRREFEQGNLPCVHVKFGVEHAVLNLPVGVDPIGGIWSHIASHSRAAVLSPEKQYSGIDRREVVIDDRTSTALNNFKSITDLIQWRVARQPEDLAYCTIDARSREGKGLTWKKFDTKVAAVAMYLKNKVKVRSGDHVILMYTHSEEYVFAVHACANLGAIVIPTSPLDQARLNEDVPAFLHVVADYRVKAVLVNQEVDSLIKMKQIASHIKQSAQILKISIPPIHNTTKPPRQNNGCRELGLTVDPAWVQPGYPVIIWTYWTPDQRRIAVQLGHDTILGMCKVQKETCQMTSSRPVLGCVRSYTGLGFIHSCLVGIYVGTPTYLLSPVEFAANPTSLFTTLSRYKIKDTYATGQMLDYAMASMQAKNFTLHELKNMMISSEGRPRVDVFQKVRLHFAANGLDRTSINTIYSHVLNPMITSRSYMCIEPMELWLDAKALRRGLVVSVDPDSDPKALLVQDSGMVPVSTHIAIVNPESRVHCNDGEFGEIWVDSEACVKSFYGSKDMFDAERFDGRTADGDPHIKFVRTGDLGFLHNVSRPIGPGGTQVDMQVLFVLGNIGETFEINGLNHFPMDIEASVERSHRNIVPNGCAVFQAGGLVVVLVEVTRKAYLASIVPVIVNAVLNEHQIIVDIVAFVARGDFPRSRLGEKQRGKILATWINRKMRTMAQFAIRDMDYSPGDPVTGGPGAPLHRQSTSSVQNTGHGPPPPPPAAAASNLTNLRNMEQAPQILEQEEVEQQMMNLAALPPRATAIAEMPGDQQTLRGTPMAASTMDRQSTRNMTMSGQQQRAVRRQPSMPMYSDDRPGSYLAAGRRKLAIVNRDVPPQSVVSPMSTMTSTRHSVSPVEPGLGSPGLRLPAIDGREPLDWDQQIADKADDDDWPAEAIMHMNLAGR